MQSITVSCSPSNGVLVSGVGKESRTAHKILKAHNLEWWPRGRAWYLPRMRNKPISDRVITYIQGMAQELSEAGFSVQLLLKKIPHIETNSCGLS